MLKIKLTDNEEIVIDAGTIKSDNPLLEQYARDVYSETLQGLHIPDADFALAQILASRLNGEVDSNLYEPESDIDTKDGKQVVY